MKGLLKLIIFCTACLSTLPVLSQNLAQNSNSVAPSGSKHLFAQGMLNMDDEAAIREREAEMRNNPFIQVVRLDVFSKRFFILTRGLDHLSESELQTWFSEDASEISCVQIGIHGIDKVNPFPFENCND